MDLPGAMRGGFLRIIKSSKYRGFGLKFGVRLRRWTAMSRQSYAGFFDGTIRVNPLVASAVFSFKLSDLCVLRIRRALARANDVEVNENG